MKINPMVFLDGRVTLHVGDCRDVLAGLPSDSVDCVVTSPPYWRLRDYGVDGQIGMEPTLGEHIAVIVEVMEHVRRILKTEGTCWFNYGDCYATTPNGQGNLKPGDLCMVPNRIAIALQDAGGQDNPSLRAGLAVSDKVLVPVSPRSFETWALENMASLIEEASITNPKLEAFAVLNLAFPRGSDNSQTQDIIREDYPKLALIEPNIVQRKVFSDAVGQGLSVLEAKPRNPDAIGELLGLLGGIGINQNDIEVIYNGRAA